MAGTEEASGLPGKLSGKTRCITGMTATVHWEKNTHSNWLGREIAESTRALCEWRR